MLNKFFNFLKGYVIIDIIGRGRERFINICLRRGIKIWGILPGNGKCSLCVYVKDFKRLREIRRKCSVSIRILKKKSVFHTLLRYRKRYVFLACMILSAFFIFHTSGYIWAVEINGVENTDVIELSRLLEENGIYVGSRKAKLPLISDIKTNIINRTDDIAWLWIYMEGTKARVEVWERRVPHKIIEKDIPVNIVSLSDGVIEDITVKSGEAAVSVGDAVEKGDILIGSKVRAYREGEEENYIYVHSIGDVRAYTIHTQTEEEKLYDEIRTPTGKIKRQITLELFGKKYDFFRDKKIEFSDYDIKTDCYELKLPFLGFTGIALTVRKNLEVDVEHREISLDIAKERAKNRAEEKIAKKLNPFSVLLGSETEYEKINKDTIKVNCTMSFSELIGTEEILRSENIDEQTD